jgi:hypothetical protein
MIKEKVFGIIGSLYLTIFFILYSYFEVMFRSTESVYLIFYLIPIFFGFSLIALSVYFISKKLNDKKINIYYLIFLFFFILSLITIKPLGVIISLLLIILFSSIAFMGLHYSFNRISIYIEKPWFYYSVAIFVMGIMLYILGNSFCVLSEGRICFGELAFMLYIPFSIFMIISFIKLPEDMEKFADKKFPINLTYVNYMNKKKFEKSVEFSPLEMLKMRYAKGEITKKEFEDMKKDLEG